MGVLNRFKISDDFYLNEFESPDTHEVMVDPELVHELQLLRDLLLEPLVVDSGYRTPEHNKAVGGVAGSFHRKGQAVDVSTAALELRTLAKAAVEAGFRTVIAYKEKNFVHCALGPKDQIIVPRDWIPLMRAFFPEKAELVYAFEDVFPV